MMVSATPIHINFQVRKVKEEVIVGDLQSNSEEQQRPPGYQLQYVKAASASSTGLQGRGSIRASLGNILVAVPLLLGHRRSSTGAPAAASGGPGRPGKPPGNREGKRTPGGPDNHPEAVEQLGEA